MNSLPLPSPPVAVVGSGAGWLVIEKPSGMSVHNDPGRDLCSLLSAYLQSSENLAKTLRFDPAYGLHAVHRLDKETSGLILMACRREAFQHLALQFSQGKVFKQYLALVHGAVCQTEARGLWQWPLNPKAAGRRNIQGQGKRIPSRTRFRILQRSPHYTLVACNPLTGRTHQIRRHAALAGHPIVGDQRYGSLRACRYVARHHGFTRLALHAAALSVTVPCSFELQTFESLGGFTEINALIHCDRSIE